MGLPADAILNVQIIYYGVPLFIFVLNCLFKVPNPLLFYLQNY